MTKLRKRWVLPSIGRSNLELIQEPIPELAPHEVLVRTTALSLNFHDKLVVDNGLDYGGGSFTPGSDLAGEIVDTGSAVTRFRAGEHVITTYLPGWLDGANLRSPRTSVMGTLGGAYPGVFADFVVLDEEWLVSAPSGLTPEEAACLPCAGLTAWFALVEKGQIKAGQSVLVHGTGGVALFAAQIALAHGARVFVTSRSAAKLERVSELGVQETIDSTGADWVGEVMKRTRGRGVDLIVETVGGNHVGRSLEAAANGASIALVGVFGGGEVVAGFRALAAKHLTMHGIGVGHRRGLEDFVRAVETAKIRPVIEATFRFEELPAALDRLDQGPFGKVVLKP